MGAITNPANFLLSGVTANGTGSATGRIPNANVLDCRAGWGAYLHYECAGNSAIFDVQASYDIARGWQTIATYTATATQTGTANHSAIYPFVRAVARSIYSAAGGSAQLWVFWHPLV